MTDAKESDAGSEEESEDLSLGEPGAVGGQGRAGGRLAREIGTEDELKRAFERPAGKTRVTRTDEKK
jgi:hypothetical protein